MSSGLFFSGIRQILLLYIGQYMCCIYVVICTYAVDFKETTQQEVLPVSIGTARYITRFVHSAFREEGTFNISRR
jgi:hypothetical protein